jgi:hypothetical protein
MRENDKSLLDSDIVLAVSAWAILTIAGAIISLFLIVIADRLWVSYERYTEIRVIVTEVVK